MRLMTISRGGTRPMSGVPGRHRHPYAASGLGACLLDDAKLFQENEDGVVAEQAH